MSELDDLFGPVIPAQGGGLRNWEANETLSCYELNQATAQDLAQLLVSSRAKITSPLSLTTHKSVNACIILSPKLPVSARESKNGHLENAANLFRRYGLPVQTDFIEIR